MFFCKEERENVKLNNPEIDNKEILKELGLRWKDLKENDKEKLKHFENLAKDDKERFLKEKEDGNGEEENDEDNPKKSKKQKNKKDSSDENEIENENKVPKKTKVNGYINFCKTKRESVKNDNPKLSPKEITIELAKLWKKLSNEDKESWKNN